MVDGTPMIEPIHVYKVSALLGRCGCLASIDAATAASRKMEGGRGGGGR